MRFRDMQRQRELKDKGLLPQAEYELAVRRADEARTQLKLSKERLALQEANAALRAVLATISGICVVIAFRLETKLAIVTAWRERA